MKKWLTDATVDERICIARSRLAKIVDNLISLIHLHETNRIVCYSDKLASQITPSFAGHHFKLFQHTMLTGEALRLCTLWDGVGKDRVSLPTIAALIEDEGVLATIKNQAAECRKNNRHLTTEGNDPELLAWMKTMSDEGVEESVAERDTALRNAISDIREVVQSETLQAVRQFRNFHMAHSLDTSTIAQSVLPYKYGYERALLEKTIPIVDDLYLGVCQTGFTWNDSREMAKDYAQALWSGCRFANIR